MQTPSSAHTFAQSLQTHASKLASLVNLPYILGFAAALTWMGTFYAVVPQTGTAASASSLSTNVYLLSLGATIVVDTLLAARVHTYTPRSRGSIAAALVMSTAALMLALTPTAPSALTICGGLVAGAASTFLLLYWAIAFGALPLVHMLPSLILSYIIMSASNSFFSLSNLYTAIVMAVGLPLLSLACLWLGAKTAPQHEDTPTATSQAWLPPVLTAKLCAIFLIWAAINRLLRALYVDALGSAPLLGTVIHAAATVLVALVVLALVGVFVARPQSFRFEYAYRAFFFIALTGVVLLPLAVDHRDPGVGYACNTASYHLFCMFMWVIIAVCCHNHPAVAPRIYGLLGGFWALGAIVGVSATHVVSTPISATDAAPIVALGVLLLSLCYLVVFTERNAAQLAQILPVQRKRPFKEKCAAVAQQYRLSAREQDVMLLIAQGRDTAAIQERLSLSASTVQTHRMHIYQKLGIHSKQELIDVVEAVDASHTPIS